MSGWFNKLRGKVSSEQAEKAADAIEKNVTEERVDSVLNKVPGGQSLADKTPDDIGERAADAVRSNLGNKKPEA